MKIIKQNLGANVQFFQRMFYREVGHAYSSKKTDMVASTQERLQLCMLAFAKSNQNRVIVRPMGLFSLMLYVLI